MARRHGDEHAVWVGVWVELWVCGCVGVGVGGCACVCARAGAKGGLEVIKEAASRPTRLSRVPLASVSIGNHFLDSGRTCSATPSVDTNAIGTPRNAENQASASYEIRGDGETGARAKGGKKRRQHGETGRPGDGVGGRLRCVRHEQTRTRRRPKYTHMHARTR